MTVLSDVPPLNMADAVDAVETDLLLEGLQQRWGYDLRGYDRRQARPRLTALLRAHHFPSLSVLQGHALRDPREAEAVVAALARPRRRLFGDPAFWLALRRRAVPFLRTYPSPRLWAPSCGTGEDAYALAVVLEEEGLGGKAEIYATDLLAATVEEARRGRVGPAALRGAQDRHARAGGIRHLAEQFRTEPQGEILRTPLRQRIVLGTHSLATDGPINEFQFVLCRGLLPRFRPELRRRVLTLVRDSLCPLGLVALEPDAGDLQSFGLLPFAPREGLWRRLP
ncbi:MAG TPA: CheR family methyltransferase [Candidatus Polarisedimenticolaceae bacterium]|nr:CheR family methyltransferase [Candidatus Polarisedimenticolaceae bacterium]